MIFFCKKIKAQITEESAANKKMPLIGALSFSFFNYFLYSGNC